MSLGRKSSDYGVDLTHLKVALDNIQLQVQVPFLERRARSNKHHKDYAAELLEVIEELNERESELNAAVGIAKMLLEKMTVAQDTVKATYEDLEHTDHRARMLEDELTILRSSHEALEKENSSLSHTIEALEHHVAELAQDNADLTEKVVLYKAKAKTLTKAHKEQLEQEVELIAAEKEAHRNELASKV